MVDTSRSGAVVQDQPAAFLTPKDLQHDLQIGEQLCYRLLRSGEIPSVRIGGVYRIPRQRLEEALLDSPNLSNDEGPGLCRQATPGPDTPTAKERDAILPR